MANEERHETADGPSHDAALGSKLVWWYVATLTAKNVSNIVCGGFERRNCNKTATTTSTYHVGYSDVRCVLDTPLTNKHFPTHTRRDIVFPVSLQFHNHSLERRYSTLFTSKHAAMDTLACTVEGLLGIALLTKGYHLSGLPLLQTWHDTAQGIHFTILLCLRLLPALTYTVLSEASYCALRPALIGTIRTMHASSAMFYVWLMHTCNGAMPCFVLRGHFLDILALNGVLLPIIYPLQFAWTLLVQLLHFTTGMFALASGQGLCASVANTHAITSDVRWSHTTSPSTCLRLQPDGERCAAFITQQRDFFAWLRTVLAYISGVGQPMVDMEGRPPLPVTTACCIVSVAALLVVQLCVSSILYLLELKERVVFYEEHALGVQVHPPWRMLRAWVGMHFALAVGALAFAVGLVL